MKPFLFPAFIAFFAFLSCKSSSKATENLPKQGIQGIVEQVSGNRMPRIGREPDKPKPFPTTVFIYEPTDITQVSRVGQEPTYRAIHTKLVSTIETDSTGKFRISLPKGRYSVFVQVGKLFFANSFDIRNNISLVTVGEGEWADIEILVNNTASN